MLKLFCGICGHIYERNITDAWGNCDDCEMASGWKVIDADQDSIRELGELFQFVGKQAHLNNEWLKSTIFPVFRHEPTLTVEYLDILVLFFENVLLHVDAFHIEKENESQLLDKLNAYIEEGFVKIYSHDNDIVTNISLQRPHISSTRLLDAHPQRDKYFMNLADYLQLQAEFETKNDIDRSPNAYEILKKNGSPFNLNNPAATMVLNRINAYSALTDSFGITPIFESWLRPFKSVKYEHRVHDLLALEKTSEVVASWYSHKVDELPKLKTPETLIKFRNNVSRDSFLNVIMNTYLSCSNRCDSTELSNKLSLTLDKHILEAKKITGESYQTKSKLLSGLFATLGGIMGGPTGSIIGGVGGTSATLLAEHFDKKRIGKWATFFID